MSRTRPHFGPPLLSAMLSDLEELVMAETPSDELDLLRTAMTLTAGMVERIVGASPELLAMDGRPLLRLRGETNGILLLCHLDTVWPAGTTARWPFSITDGRATGPGIFDMKTGLIQGLYALQGLPRVSAVTLLITSDEEIGSPSSRDLIEEEARRARAVLVLEPSADGRLKVARKGISQYRLAVTGRAAHAGLEPERGVNALLELAGHVSTIAAIGDPAQGTTVTPTRARAGTAANTVPAAAELDVDVRAWTHAEQRRVDQAMRGLRPIIPGAHLELTGGINRPPLETRRSANLARLAEECAAALGSPPLGTAHVGGASDGNITAALGVATLDGLGAVGSGAHAEGEYVEVDTLPRRAALVRALIERIVEATTRPSLSDTEEARS